MNHKTMNHKRHAIREGHPKADARPQRTRIGVILALCFALLASMLNLSAAAATEDVEAPSKPGSRGYSLTEDSVTIKWNEATDNVGVVSYRVRLLGTDFDVTLPANRRAMKFRNVAPKARYRYSVSAIDAAGNVSDERFGSFRMMNAGQSSASVKAVYEVTDALEAWAIANGNFNTGGRNGQGWFAFENGTTYPVRMVDTLIDAGYLDESYRSIHVQDLMVYRCGSGDNQRAAVFSSASREVFAGDAAQWDGCTRRPINNYGHGYYQTTRTLGEIAAAPFDEVVIDNRGYSSLQSAFLVHLSLPKYATGNTVRWVVEGPSGIETIETDDEGYAGLYYVDPENVEVMADGFVELLIHVESVDQPTQFQSATQLFRLRVFGD